MQAFPTSGEENQSLFNAGVAKLKRIDKLRIKIHDSRSELDYNNWFSALLGIREELCERMTPEEETECDKTELNIQKVLDSNLQLLKNNMLNKYGRYLSKIEYKYGYSMPDKEDDEGL